MVAGLGCATAPHPAAGSVCFACEKVLAQGTWNPFFPTLGPPDTCLS